MTSNNLAEGLFDKRDFVYDAKNDEYRCPAGRIGTYRFTTEEAGKTLHKYWSSDCPQCPMKPRCTKGKYRGIARWEHEDILDVVQQRLEGAPEAMKLRRQTVEHVFGTLKAWMGSSHFLTRTLPLRSSIGTIEEAGDLAGAASPRFRVILTGIRALDVSSTAVRDRVRRGRSLDGLVPRGVASYIREHQLYLGR